MTTFPSFILIPHHRSRTKEIRIVQRTIENLVKDGKQGDRTALKALYDQFVPEMLSAAFKITNSMSDAEDIVQESFVKSFKKLGSIREPRSYPYWLKKIVINESLQKIKRKYSWVDLDEDSIVVHDADHSWYRNISMNQINQGISELPNGCRQILILYLLEDYKHKEIAELLKISISTSKSQYRYALSLLKNNLHKKLKNEF